MPPTYKKATMKQEQEFWNKTMKYYNAMEKLMVILQTKTYANKDEICIGSAI